MRQYGSNSSQMESLEQLPQEGLLVTIVTQLRFALEVKNIKTILDEKNLSFIILKGPHLGNTIYSDPIERVYCDLDLLVRPKHFDSIIAILLSNEYKLLFSDNKRFITEKHFYCWHLISPQGVSVEIHRSNPWGRCCEAAFAELKAQGSKRTDQSLGYYIIWSLDTTSV